ncbi:hypothetical protein MBLNU457_g2900t2 [Dothideomycetes sp. NU457]
MARQKYLLLIQPDLLSGGADSSVAIWDLEASAPNDENLTVHQPLGYVSKDTIGHNAGITHVSFYAFDSLAFLSSSYDHNLKLYASETLQSSASFDLGSVVYSHALSPIASHLLVACATQHPAVRLVDLNSGASTHSLAGHGGAVLSVAWHPKREHILASAASDGSVRVWDIRRSASSLGVLSMDDSIGLFGTDGLGGDVRRRERGSSHAGPANGVLWTDSGDFLVSTGHDERVRVWSANTGANTLVNFGPTIKNSHTSTLLPLVSPSQYTGPMKELLFFPNPRELLVYELHTGKLINRLRTPSYSSSHTAVGAGSGTRNVLNRTTSLAWRPYNVELFSAHTDGTIRCWRPQELQTTIESDDEDEDTNEREHEEASERKRKREELDDIVNSLTKRKVTFT